MGRQRTCRPQTARGEPVSSAINSFESYSNFKKIWVVADVRRSEVAPGPASDGDAHKPARQYRLSDIGRYLLNPNTIEIKKRLIGCEVHHKLNGFQKIGKALRRMLPGFAGRRQNGPFPAPEVMVSRFKLQIPPLKDSGLREHISQICDQLRVHDSIGRRLARLEPRRVFELVGICEDIGGSYSYLKLQGSIEEKIKYLTNYVAKDVGVILSKAYVGDGLFELRGYDFQSYEEQRSWQLVAGDGAVDAKICVLRDENHLEYQLEDPLLIKLLQLLEHCLQADEDMKQAFGLCIEGRAQPIKLFFNKKLEIDYNHSPLPSVYRQVFNTLNVSANQKKRVKSLLNYLQIGVSLTYVPFDDEHDERMFTHITVLHDIRALEPLRKYLPEVYAQMRRRTFRSEAGRFYLLDSINGYSNG